MTAASRPASNGCTNMTDMRKHRRLFAVALCMALAAGAARAEPALWKVTGGKSTVYLFGSVHLLPEGGFTVGGELADALKQADRVCMEIDPAAQDEAATTAITLARAVDPEGRTLFDLLGDDADRVRAAAEDAGVPLEALSMFEPWFAGTHGVRDGAAGARLRRRARRRADHRGGGPAGKASPAAASRRSTGSSACSTACRPNCRRKSSCRRSMKRVTSTR